MRRLLALATVVAMVGISAVTLQSLVVPALWLGRTLVCGGAAMLVTTLLRTRTRSAGLPSLLGLVTGLLAITAVYFPDDALLGVLPTQSTIRSVVELVPLTLEQMRTSYPPIGTGDGVALLVTAGVLLVLVLAEMLAIGAWAPAWSGLPVLGLWCVPIMLGAPVSTPVLVLAAAAYVLLIAVQARDDTRYRRRPSAASAAATAAVTVTALVAAFALAPTLLRVPVPVRWHPIYELVGSSTTRLDLGLGLRDDLLRSTDSDLFTWTGAEPEQVGPLHAYTVDTFDGSSWSRPDRGELVPFEGQLLWPTPTDGLPSGDPVDIRISVQHLGQDRLLLPGEPRLLDLDTGADYLAAADEVVAHVGGAITYGVRIVPRELDGDRLASLRPPDDVPAELLALPETGYESDIAEVARDVVAEAGAETPYEQLLAIQNYLRDPARFVYSTSVAAPSTPDAVWDFLNDRHGYCVQFATAMVVMARTLGFPARLAVGFLPGEAGSDGVVAVTSHDAHAWPQVLFDDVGWVRFEPTPGVQAGPPPEYAPEQPTAATTEPTTSATSTQPTAGRSEATTTTGGQTPATEETSGGSPWLLVLALLVLAAVGASTLATRRARRSPDLRERWDHVLHHLARLGVDVSPTRTPRAVAREAAELLDDDGAAALLRLAGAVETFSYAPRGTALPDDAELTGWLDAALSSARAAHREQRRDRVGV